MGTSPKPHKMGEGMPAMLKKEIIGVYWKSFDETTQ